jgi:hypothetical protein
MMGATPKKPEPGKAPGPLPAREARLAEALRANLRRRKAATQAVASPEAALPPSETD